MQKDVICRFNALWPKTNETLIIKKTEYTDKSKIGKSKRVSDNVYFSGCQDR